MKDKDLFMPFVFIWKKLLGGGRTSFSTKCRRIGFVVKLLMIGAVITLILSVIAGIAAKLGLIDPISTRQEAKSPVAPKKVEQLKQDKTELKVKQLDQKKLEIKPMTQQVKQMAVIGNSQDEAADFQKIVEWNQTQEAALAQYQVALQEVLATGDKVKIEESLKIFTRKVKDVLKSLDAVDVKSESVAQFKAKTKETLMLSNELIADSVKAMANPSEEINKVLQEKSQVLVKAGNDLKKLEEQLKQKFMPSSKVNSSEGIVVKRPDTSNTNIPLADLKFNEGLAVFEDVSTGLKGYVDSNGKVVVKPQFAAAGGFYQGRAVVKNTQEEWGYIDKSGNWVISPKFCSAARFSEGLAGVYVGGVRDENGDCVQGKWGFISVTGKMVIAPQFDKIWRFEKTKNSSAKAKVVLDGYTGYINSKGEWVD